MPNEEKFVEAIVDKSVDFSGWYVDVVVKAQLADSALKNKSGYTVHGVGP